MTAAKKLPPTPPPLNVDTMSAEARFALPRLVARRHDLIVSRARQNPQVFATHVLRDEKTGKRIKLAPMHMRWHELIDQHPRLLLWSFVEAGKTAGITVGRSLWEIGRNPNLRVAILSKTKPLAQKIVRSCQTIIAGDSAASVAYREVFPHVTPAKDPSMPWTSMAITIERSIPVRDPSIQACGNFGNIIGSRIDLLILDDVLDSTNTRTPAPRDALWEWVHGTLVGRMTEGGRIIIIGNAWHPDDLMHRFERAPGYKAFRFPVVDADGELAWPERWSADRIEKAKDDFGPLDYARQLFCQPRDDDSSKFKREWIDACLQRGVGLDFVASRAELLDELLDPATAAAYRLGDTAVGQDIPIYVGVDLAVQQHSSADLTAFSTVALLPNGTRRLLNIESGRWGAPEILKRLDDHDARYKPIFVVENVAAQDYIVQLAQARGLPVIPYTTGSKIAHPEFGIEGLAAEFAAAQWVFPNRTGGMHRELFALIQDFLSYDPKAHKGDRMMGLFFAREGLRMLGGRATTGGQARVRVFSPDDAQG